jgi:hypothetical protein
METCAVKDGIMLRLRLGIAATLTLMVIGSVGAQITPPRVLSAQVDRLANLEEQLTNRLRATAEDQRNYIKFVVTQVRESKLDIKLVVAVERYARRRHPRLPFLFFERALRYEANKRGVTLPSVRQFASTKTPRG